MRLAICWSLVPGWRWVRSKTCSHAGQEGGLAAFCYTRGYASPTTFVTKSWCAASHRLLLDRRNDPNALSCAARCRL